MRRRKAQSILEYILVLSAVVVAVIAASQGVVTNAVNQMFTDSSNVITGRTSTFANSAASNN